MTVVIKQRDTARTFTDVLTIDSVPINLTGASVKFVLRKPTGVVVKQTATIVTPVGGEVSYQPIATDFELSGTYAQEWEVTTSDSKVITFPSFGHNVIEVNPDLG